MVEEGMSVHKGQLLARLDRRLLMAEVMRLQAQAETQRHRVDELKAGSRPADIRAAEARMNAALARRERAATDLVRVQALVQRNAASPQQRDTAKADADVAAANYLEAVQFLDLAREGPRAEANRFGIIVPGPGNRIRQFQEKPAEAEGLPDDPEHVFASMGNYVFSKKFLVQALAEDARDASRVPG